MDAMTKKVLVDKLFKVYYTAIDMKAHREDARRRHYEALNIVGLILDQAKDDKDTI